MHIYFIIYIFRYWFMHDDSTCQLLFYNSANDDSPRGKIDISIATFKFVPENAKHGEFTISRYELSVNTLSWRLAN